MFWLRLRAPAHVLRPAALLLLLPPPPARWRSAASNPLFLAKCGPFFYLVLPQTQKETEVLSLKFTSATFIIFFCVCPLATQSDVSSESIELLSSRHHHITHTILHPEQESLPTAASVKKSERLIL